MVEKFLTPLIEKGVSAHIKNVKTDLRVLVCGDHFFPVTINETEYENSYVCSPFSYFISYAKEESNAHLTSKWAAPLIRMLLHGAEKILKWFQVNKIIIINNWFSSTNLYSPIPPVQLEQIVRFLKRRYPDHAIVFRSLDSRPVGVI